MSEKQRILSFLKLLWESVIAEGGDGDALWRSKHLSIDEILPVLKEFNSTLEFPFEISVDEMGEKILWHRGQEYIVITSNAEIAARRPKWTSLYIEG